MKLFFETAPLLIAALAVICGLCLGLPLTVTSVIEQTFDKTFFVGLFFGIAGIVAALYLIAEG